MDMNERARFVRDWQERGGGLWVPHVSRFVRDVGIQARGFVSGYRFQRYRKRGEEICGFSRRAGSITGAAAPEGAWVTRTVTARLESRAPIRIQPTKAVL